MSKCHELWNISKRIILNGSQLGKRGLYDAVGGQKKQKIDENRADILNEKGLLRSIK